jgi:hypothetical protein
MIPEIAKWIIKESIYPTQEELRKMTYDFLVDNHDEYIKSFSKKKWDILYEKEFYRPVS